MLAAMTKFMRRTMRSVGFFVTPKLPGARRRRRSKECILFMICALITGAYTLSLVTSCKRGVASGGNHEHLTLPSPAATKAPSDPSAASSAAVTFPIAKVPFEEKLIVALPAELDASPVRRRSYVGPDAKTFAYPLTKSGKKYMVVNGKAEDGFDDVGFPHILPGGDVVYQAKKGNRRLLVVNGAIEGEYDAVVVGLDVSGIKLSMDDIKNPPWKGFSSERGLLIQPEMNQTSGRWACITKRGGRASLFSIPKHGFAEYQEIDWPRYAEDRDSMAYAARTGQGWSLVVDDERGPEFDQIRYVVFGPGKEIMYTARQKKRWSIVHAGKVGAEFDDIREPLFGPHAEIAYPARTAKEWRMVKDEQPQGEAFDEVRHPVFSREGKLAYVGLRKRGADGTFTQAFVVVGTTVNGPFDVGVLPPIGNPAFVEGWGLVCPVKTGARWRLFLNDKLTGPEYDQISRTIVLDSSSRLAGSEPVPDSVVFIAKRGQKTLVVRGTRNGGREEYAEGPPFDDVGWVIAGPRGTPVYSAREGESWLVVAGSKRSQGFEDVWQYGFDAAGSKLAYGSLKNREIWKRVLELN